MRAARRSRRARSPRRPARSRSTCSKEPVGKQDPYVAAHGGICAYTFNPDGSVDVEPLELARETLAQAARATSCSSTPARRARRRRAGRPGRAHARRGDEEMLENLHRTKEMGTASRELLEAGRPRRLRRADARALGEQAPALARDGHRAASTRSTRSRGAAARSAASSSAQAAAASCSSTRAAPTDTRQAMAAAGAQELAVRLRVRGRVRERVRMSDDALRVGDRRAAG